MNKFEKVSFEEYKKAIGGDADLTQEYNDIKLPKRSTTGSAGYDVFAPFSFDLAVGETIKIPTGLRILLDNDKFLGLYPRSGLGFKYRIQFDNTIPVIDSDYSQSDNEGHIMIKITNDGREGKILHVNKGEAFAQGIIQPFFKTIDDEADGIRNGGMGSTTNDIK